MLSGLSLVICNILSSKCVERSKPLSLNSPLESTVSILSSPLKAPRCSPLSSVLSRRTVSSYQISRAPSVEIPSSRCTIFLTVCFVRIFPCTPLPLMVNSLKSKSKVVFFSLGFARRLTLMISPSPFALAVK